MTYELLCGGPLDGLPILMIGLPSYQPSEEVVKEYPGSKGVRYIRKSDGRLHHDGSRWDLA